MDSEIPTFCALRVDHTHIYYKCPTCFTKYKKNGEPYKTAKHVIHRHGSCNDLSNRTEHRSHHKCYNNPSNTSTYESCNIIINDDTERPE